MSQSNWEADKMLDVYIHDYFLKRDLKNTAQAFQTEGKVSSDPVAIDAPGGFLFEWWSVFWDIFIARTNEKHSDVAASYIEAQFAKARGELPQPPLLLPQSQQQLPQNQQQQLHMQHLLLQRSAHQQQQQSQSQLQQQQSQSQLQQQQSQPQLQQQQSQPQLQQQQQRDSSHVLNVTANGMGSNEPNVCQKGGTTNATAMKVFEEKLKLPVQRDSVDDAALKRFGDNAGQLPEAANQASLKQMQAPIGQSSGQLLQGTTGGLPPQVQTRNSQMAGSSPDIKAEINPIQNPRGTGQEGSLVGVPGTNQIGSNLPLKGRPLTLQKPFLQGNQPFHQLQMLTPQHQQQLLLAQQNLVSPSASEESRRFRMLVNNRSIGLSKDGLSNVVGDVMPNVGSPLSIGGSLLPRGDTEMLIKLKMAQWQQQQQNNNLMQQPQSQQHPLANLQSQNSSHILHQQDRLAVSSSIAADGSLSNSFRGNDQVPKNQPGRKRKQPVPSSGPANSSGTGNTAGPSASSAPSTPSTHTPGDVMSMPGLAQSGNSSKPLIVFGSDTAGSLGSPCDQLADIDRFVEDGALDVNVESFLSPDDTDIQDTVGRCMDVSKGISFHEFNSVRASSNKVICCHFSSDGKLLATGGHDKKAVLWYADTLKPKATLDEHTHMITDVRFSPSMSRLATSSFDKTVRVWDADNPDYSLRDFMGHSASVISLDFHPIKDDLICSCDSDGEIRYWSVTNGSFTSVFKGGTVQTRFQPRHGRYLASAGEDVISIVDVDSQTCLQTLQGHTKRIQSICWDSAGDFLASVSEDYVKVWSLGAGAEGECVHELSCSGNKFQSCVFHPSYPSLLVIGCYQSLELWNVRENKRRSVAAHDGLIAALAASNVTGLVASASHDQTVKLWK
ncbi:hypothetical protein MLD38_014102 [Melastoma candidum]|uniref:Uncharacterized protein n=1 Tax=Melastoma candidum TaxID=119954 RepID=A0ACB9RC97_9MYRT|nr:hypothetical protein MLD38_014102 [Melastoma candidum]